MAELIKSIAQTNLGTAKQKRLVWLEQIHPRLMPVCLNDVMRYTVVVSQEIYQEFTHYLRSQLHQTQLHQTQLSQVCQL